MPIWEEQIGISGIGVTDDFFEVGGDLLIGALVFAAIEEVSGKEFAGLDTADCPHHSQAGGTDPA